MAGKTGYLYVFDRATGAPIWPIEERPVPTKSEIPGERVWPTQPFPTNPPPFSKLSLKAAEVNPHILTPESETTTHYFFCHEPTEHGREMAEQVFRREDEPMIRAVFESMDGADFWDLKPLILPSDGGALRRHRRSHGPGTSRRLRAGRAPDRLDAAGIRH